jgi:hypothetical protein
MKLEDIFTGDNGEITIRVKPSISDEKFSKIYNKKVQITFSQDSYWLTLSEQERFEIEGIADADNSKLDKVSFSQSLFFLIKAEDKKAEIKVKTFTSKIPISEKLEIGFGDIIVDDIDKRFSRQLQNKAKDVWLKEQLIIEEDNSNIILVNGSPNGDGFRVFGKKIIVDIKNSENKLEIVKVVKVNKNNKPDSFIEIEKIEIKDISKTAEIRGNISQALNQISSTEKYLNTWKEYKLKEEEKSLEQVQKYGFLTITNIKKIGYDKYKISYKDNKNTKDWLNIELESHIEFLTKREFPSSEIKMQNLKAKLIVKNDGYIEVISKEKINNNQLKYAILSLIGDQAIQSRREWALEAIKNGATPMPQLVGILEGIEVATIERRKIKPLTSKVKKLFGEFGPNEMQEYALERALNTPDIVIVQGPPGTGKTKVITALSERLTELYKEEGKSPDKNILLTAFQHDAVDNMVNQTEVLGLPTIKAGKSKSIDTIERWINQKIEEVEAEQSCIELNENEFIYEELKKEYIAYIEELDNNRVKKFLLKFKEDNLTSLDMDLIKRIDNLFDVKQVIDKKISKKIEGLVRNIRTDKISYEDDGEINLKRFLKNYERYKEEIPKLENIAFFNTFLEGNDELDFEELENIKLNYLDALVSEESTKEIDVPIQKIEKLFKDLLETFSQKIKSHGSVYSVLTEYQNDLTSNKSEVQKAVEQYSALLASTIQGSKSKALRNLKSDPFDTVIVDEAARPNPLDLLIPLTSAKRRIVLVGDHRQLPHIIDNALQQKVIEGENISKDANKHLQDSLFERFYLILKRLAKKNNVVRVVTLDTQYRMHPEIGNFISRTFYEKYGDPKIKAGTLAKNRVHGINKYQNKVAISINIPNIKGGEKQQFGSTYRPIEAREIIREAKDILDNNPEKSVGIITFYSRQVSEIFKEALNVGLVEKDKEENYVIASKYAKTLEEAERFRIGSVDAFQGKEFDIVLLSLVRSNTHSDIRRKYGFLTSYNRLNVAMSRAKELLITVGDESMFTDENAKEHIYGLYAFYKELIGGKYGCSI